MPRPLPLRASIYWEPYQIFKAEISNFKPQIPTQ